VEPKAAHLPTGTVTFLFSDIEGSTVRWDAHRAEMEEVVRRHDELMRGAIERNGGYVFKTIGDAFCAAFATVPEAIAAALEAQRALGNADWGAVGGLRVRMAIHAGVADERDSDYFGPTVNRVARLLDVGHGGQVLLSVTARDLANEVLPAAATLRDLGIHRLRDLSRPERVFQLCAPDLEVEFPELRSLDRAPNNLPAQLTPLIGREDELAEIEALLDRSRLVTLIGTGGIGKTRTALQVAADTQRGNGDGVWFVDLAPLDDPMLVPSAIAEVFNIADDGGTRNLIDLVAKALRSKKLLIVLDNCEHVISAAADAAERLLRACPGLRILATSREPLGVAGEEHYRMPPLAVPPEGVLMTAERVMHYAAAALFVARTHSVQRTFALTDENATVVAEIVRRLDGIALAIELAAPRINVLTLRELDRRLDERFTLLTHGSRTAHPRQQTLLALIGWSYDLLNPAEQSLLRRCAIFRGGWTLEAAQVICSDERFPDRNPLDLLSSLVDKSLVVFEVEGNGHSYRMLESTRQFAVDRLAETDEREELAARHCTYFTAVARRANDAYWQADTVLWTAQVRRDLENYRAAISWGLGGDGDTAAAATIVASLRWLWYETAQREGRSLTERAAALLSPDAPARVRSLIALATARLDYRTARAGSAAAEVARVLVGLTEVDRAEALTTLGQVLGRAGRQAESIASFEEGLAAARAARTPLLIAWVLTVMSYWIGTAGDRARAHALLDEAAPLLRSHDDRQGLATLLSCRAELLFADGDPAAALSNARAAEVVQRESRGESQLTTILGNAAAYLLALRRFDEAWAAVRENLELCVVRDEVDWLAVSIGHHAHLAAETGDVVRAARLLGYADAVFRKVGSTREPTEQLGYGRTRELIRAALSEDRIAVLITEGAAMEQDAAVAEALAIPQPGALHT
jgi:predicted ATPase/class 3 adenylate cyclase